MITELIARLSAAGTGYQTIDHAWDLDLIQDIEAAKPCAYFMPGPSDSESSDRLPIQQNHKRQIVVVTICDWADLDSLTTETGQLYPALLGYQHSNNHTPLEHVKGDVLAIKGRLVWWKDVFFAESWIRP